MWEVPGQVAHQKPGEGSRVRIQESEKSLQQDSRQDYSRNGVTPQSLQHFPDGTVIFRLSQFYESS